MSKIETNTIAPSTGTTLTLGESGDTVAVGSGATLWIWSYRADSLDYQFPYLQVTLILLKLGKN